MIEDVSIESSCFTVDIVCRLRVEEERAAYTKKRMSVNNAKQRFVFSKAPHLNNCFSLKALICSVPIPDISVFHIERLLSDAERNSLKKPSSFCAFFELYFRELCIYTK